MVLKRVPEKPPQIDVCSSRVQAPLLTIVDPLGQHHTIGVYVERKNAVPERHDDGVELRSGYRLLSSR
eukprot:3156144-Pyramimonas_sp.AAC.1